MTEAEREHPLMVNLLRIGLDRHLADQAIAEVEDSLWLALRDQQARAVAWELGYGQGQDDEADAMQDRPNPYQPGPP